VPFLSVPEIFVVETELMPLQKTLGTPVDHDMRALGVKQKMHSAKIQNLVRAA
jgi:hypothetical protein